jgi:dolichyl-phosphate beta-glucosyltransferase
MNQNISVIIPAYNEAERLASGIEAVVRHFETEKIKGEIIVVDDGSTDGTAARAKQSLPHSKNGITTQVIRYGQNRGKGFAVKTGLLAASGDIALFSDADLSTPISEMEKLIAPIRNGEFDVTFGSRALDRSLIGTHQPWRREQGGKVFNLVVRTFTGLPFWDTQCGFKAVRTKIFRPILKTARIERFGFDVELLFVAHFAGLRLREIPVRWNHAEGSKVSVFRDSLRMFNEVREVRRNMQRGVYDQAITEIKLLQKQRSAIAFAASA